MHTNSSCYSTDNPHPPPNIGANNVEQQPECANMNMEFNIKINTNGTGTGVDQSAAGDIRKSKSNDEEEVEDEELDSEEDEEESGSGYEENAIAEMRDEDNPENGEEEKVLVPVRELKTIKANLQLLNHQMSLLTRALNVKSCGCLDCELAQKNQQMHGSNKINNGVGNELNHHSPLESGEGESSQRGRRSKYCTPSEKKAVAGYVQIHGATAAAKKFNIPPAVAAYYHRREFKNKAIGKIGTPSADHLRQNLKGHDSSGEGERLDGSGHADGTNMAQFWQSGAHAYLRGRGRGRPKLIGDELDAELVEYIVKLKQQTPNVHLTANQALMIARNYIMQKAPGLLEENGGQVKLKNTWAMKLVTRVQEREREIQLGLPPGTLQNLPRSLAQGDASLLVDELIGQNLLNQQINVGAILAAAGAGASTDDSQGRSANQADAAMLNAMLGMAAGTSADFFGMAEQNQGTSRTSHGANTEVNTEEQDAAIRQLLASLQGGRQEEMGNDIDMSALVQMNG